MDKKSKIADIKEYIKELEAEADYGSGFAQDMIESLKSELAQMKKGTAKKKYGGTVKRKSGGKIKKQSGHNRLY